MEYADILTGMNLSHTKRQGQMRIYCFPSQIHSRGKNPDSAGRAAWRGEYHRLMSQGKNSSHHVLQMEQSLLGGGKTTAQQRYDPRKKKDQQNDYA
jgi:hypothetical protein